MGQKVEQTDKQTQIDQWWILHPCLFVCLSCPHTIYSTIYGQIWTLKVPMESLGQGKPNKTIYKVIEPEMKKKNIIGDTFF